MFVGTQASLVDFLASWGHRQPKGVCPVCVPHKPSQFSPAYGSCWTCIFIVFVFCMHWPMDRQESFPPLGYLVPILFLSYFVLMVLLTPLLPLHGPPSIIYSTNICQAFVMCQALPGPEGTEPEALPAFLGAQTSHFAHSTVHFKPYKSRPSH